jgi:CRP-like cAMP-binding protein
MYQQFFGFEVMPFNITPDPHFLYLSPTHQDALAHLRYGLAQKAGFIVLTGEVGCGKTTLCRAFLDEIEPTRVETALILNPRLTERELLRVMQAVEVRAYQAGQLVIQEGERGDELFIVLEGTVRVSRGEAVLTRLGAGEHVGEMALIRSVPRSATVTAEEGGAELIAIRRADFFEILRKEHELAVKMLWQFLGVLADRLDHMNTELHSARAELAAEDVSGEIFPVDVDTSPFNPSSDAE